MTIEKGQVTIVASGSMASLPTIENPDERLHREYLFLFTVSTQGRLHTYLMMTWSTALQDENALREKQTTS
jgi:hypothetical protein